MGTSMRRIFRERPRRDKNSAKSSDRGLPVPGCRHRRGLHRPSPRGLSEHAASFGEDEIDMEQAVSREKPSLGGGWWRRGLLLQRGPGPKPMKLGGLKSLPKEEFWLTSSSPSTTLG